MARMSTSGLINRVIVAIAAFVAMVAAVIYGSHYTTRFYLADIAERGQGTLRLSVAGLQGALSRFEYLPGLIAEDQSIKAVLRGPPLPELATRVNAHLDHVAAETRAAGIIVLDRSGRTVAAGGPGAGTPSARASFGGTPYFRSAMDGRLGRHFALEAGTAKRIYTFAVPVRLEGAIIGVIVVEVDLNSIDAAWTSPAHEIVVSDADGVVFMASRESWRLKALAPLSEDMRRSIAESGRYGGRAIADLGAARRATLGGAYELVSIADGGKWTEYLGQKAAMPRAGWTVHILSSTETARTQAAIFTIIAALLILIVVMFMVFLWQRRSRLIERIALQREAQDMLERRVAERTESLNAANARLVEEISEREAAEQELRKTQEDLIQAGKLAALGQMSTALSHEFNQPLAAIRTYADNAAVLLDRDRLPEARENVQRIGALTDRMASISKHLRNFARKPGARRAAVSLTAVIGDTLDLLAGKIAAAGVEVVVDGPPEDTLAVAGHIRLQQVLVNLMSNAIDAMETHRAPRVDIGFGPGDSPERVQLTVRDRGTGIPDGILDRVFDPFFTTKDVGQGLGLGLSISFNIVKDFGGTLRAANHPEGGAVFTIALQRAEAETGVAAE